MSYLLKPLEMNTLTLSNRLIMPPMATAKAKQDGDISNELLEYYKEKSQGGYISLIIIEHSFIKIEGKASNNQLSIADDSVIKDLKELADIIHSNGSKAVMQINHAGGTAQEGITGLTPVAPSSIVNSRTGCIPRELTKEEIKDIVKAFSNAAVRVKKAGFDGVEIHSAHGYLLNQFFSPLTNKRKDEYGGDIYNRIRIHLEIIEEVRKSVGKDFPVLLRLGAADFTEGGTTIEDSKIAVKEFEKVGIDIIDVSGGIYGYSIPGVTGQGYFATLTEEIKKTVSIPVILTGGITEVKYAEQLLREEKADLIGVGRAILTDSHWAKNSIESLR
ncbi:NADH:flavin oxidoreductase [uncultured Clostridium sp.]|uniref:NADH:flavin oxidoreductase n=1 Tax=uncultured Clostridium sp. TaxID=59620 RepID=UPI0028EE49D5|nr:NADH:flavin oxidoreductase [uncultured Clostridium sp.]